MEDRDIVALYNARDEQAIAVTKNQYGPFCYAIAMNILRSHEDAEECESDTYHVAWRRIPPDRPRTLRAYLGAITRNLSISRYRSLRAAKRFPGMEMVLDELEECVPSGESVEETVEARELAEFIGLWLETLPMESRALFVRRYWLGQSVSDMEKSLNLSAGLISQRLHRLRKQLKTFLRKRGVEI